MPSAFNHCMIVSLDVPPANLLPDFHRVLLSVREWSTDALVPIGLLPEVQNGIIVFPAKS